MTQHRWIRNFGATLAKAGGGAAVRLLALLLAAPPALAQEARAPRQAEPLVLLVQGTLASPAAAERLAAALAGSAGVAVTPERSLNALLHWRRLLAGEPADLVLEEAQFVDYRVRRRGFNVIARVRADARFAVITAPATLVSGLQDLRTRRLAVSAPPSLAALRIHELFPDPVLAPVLVALPPGADPATWILGGAVDAAMVSLEQAEAAGGTRIVLVSDALPGAGVALSPRVDASRRLAVIRALLGLQRSEAGRGALDALGVEAFDAASDELYEGAARLLRGTWPPP